MMYVADSESTDKDGYGTTPAGSAAFESAAGRFGLQLHSDLSPGIAVTSAAEGVAADADGNVYGARSAL